MTQALPQLINHEEFINWYPGDGKRYELHKKVVIEMPPPTGDHENIVGFLAVQIGYQLLQMGLSYRIPKTAFVKPTDSTYSPDILLINPTNLVNETLWKKQSTVTQAASVPLVVEVVSSNWRDDYYDKFGDYEEMGIPEYWIIDYKGLGGRDLIGNPKQPTIFVCELIEGEYQINVFKEDNLIISPNLLQLNLTAQQVFDAAL